MTNMNKEIFKRQKAKPSLSPSQLSFRIGLARERTGNYPMDNMNFIMMDLERDENFSRHAHWCTGDLTGRTLEFLSAADGIDGKKDDRLPEMVTRILKTQRKNGLFGKYVDKNMPAKEEDTKILLANINKLLPGLMRYYKLKKDSKVLDAAIKMADVILNNLPEIIVENKKFPFTFFTWIFEAFAYLYEATGDERYLNFFESLVTDMPEIDGAHSHSFLTTIRGIQTFCILTGNKKWNDIAEKYRRKIIDEHYEMTAGNISEVFPRSFRNEGCSVGDWMCVNLNAGFLNNDDSSYEKAENILWNALYFNQFITGGFGHRDLTATGYSDSGVSEAWWCCTENCGTAMTEFANHVVTCDNDTININFLIPGSYTISTNDKKNITLHITTTYPRDFDAHIQIENMPEDVNVKVRIPSFVKNEKIERKLLQGVTHIHVSGKLGHHIIHNEGKVALKYGPLVLSPSVYYWEDKFEDLLEGIGDLKGYIPQALPGKNCKIICGGYDENGFLKFDSDPLPDWSYFEEGCCSRTSVDNSAVNVTLEFDDGQRRNLRFWPLCYSISNFSYYVAPILFQDLKIEPTDK